MDPSIKEDLRFWDGTEAEYQEWKAAELASAASYFDYASPHVMIPVKTGGRLALVDEDLAEAVSLMWWAGIQTTSSCQGGPRRLPYPENLAREQLKEWKREDRLNRSAYLGFASDADARRFVEIVAPEGEDEIIGSLADHVTGGEGQAQWDEDGEFVCDNYPEKLVWRWSAIPPGWRDGQLEILLYARFDPSDIPEMCKRLRANKEAAA